MLNSQTKQDFAEISVAVVIPFFQRKPGILSAAVESAYAQTFSGHCLIIVADDGSPVSAREELSNTQESINRRLLILEKENGGAGSARNLALDAVPDSVRYVAFLDSDDVWGPNHLIHAIAALELGFDFYFSDHLSALHKNETNFERIGTLRMLDAARLDIGGEYFRMVDSVTDHIVGDGGGVIGTSNVVFRIEGFSSLRFREEFYNGQDFFFWMDLDQLGARPVFSTYVDCECGRGINIYSNSGWGTDLSLQRQVNELDVWMAVEKIYPLNDKLRAANRSTIKMLQENIIRDVFHRLMRRKPIRGDLIRRAIRSAPSSIFAVPVVLGRILLEKLGAQVAK